MKPLLLKTAASCSFGCQRSLWTGFCLLGRPRYDVESLAWQAYHCSMMRQLQTVCSPAQVIGSISGSGRITLVDNKAQAGEPTPVDLDLEKVQELYPAALLLCTLALPALATSNVQVLQWLRRGSPNSCVARCTMWDPGCQPLPREGDALLAEAQVLF